MGTCFPGIIINSVFFLDVENRFVVIKGERSEGGKNWKFGISRLILYRMDKQDPIV